MQKFRVVNFEQHASDLASQVRMKGLDQRIQTFTCTKREEKINKKFHRLTKSPQQVGATCHTIIIAMPIELNDFKQTFNKIMSAYQKKLCLMMSYFSFFFSTM